MRSDAFVLTRFGLNSLQDQGRNLSSFRRNQLWRRCPERIPIEKRGTDCTNVRIMMAIHLESEKSYWRKVDSIFANEFQSFTYLLDKRFTLRLLKI